MLKGDIGHKDVWLVDLQAGDKRPLTNVGPGVVVRDFDISPDGRELVIEQLQEHSDIVRIDLAAREQRRQVVMPKRSRAAGAPQ
jgi:Tol biopolymer transport system component